MRRHIIAAAIIGGIGLACISPDAYAESPLQQINVTPSSTQITVDPGASSTPRSVDIINVSQAPFTVAVTSNPYHVEGLAYDPRFTQLPGTVDASKWVRFTSAVKAEVPAQKLFSVDYVITVPDGTPPGGYYAVLFAETAIKTDALSGITTRGRVGDILYISVAGDVKTEGTAKVVKTPSLVIDIPVTLGVIVGNQGGVHFQTTADTIVKDMFGNKTFSYTAKAYILPQTQRALNTTWSPQASLGVYHIERTVLLPGGQKNLETETVVVIKPWVIIALIVGIILIVISAIISIHNASRKKSR